MPLTAGHLVGASTPPSPPIYFENGSSICFSSCVAPASPCRGGPSRGCTTASLPADLGLEPQVTGMACTIATCASRLCCVAAAALALLPYCGGGGGAVSFIEDRHANVFKRHCSISLLVHHCNCRQLRVQASADATSSSSSAAAAASPAAAAAVDTLHRAAADSSVAPTAVFAALRTLEQAKLQPSAEWCAGRLAWGCSPRDGAWVQRCGRAGAPAQEPSGQCL